MLARENPEAHVVVDPCRTRGGKWALERIRPDVLILDDGYQHLAVQRDVDLVLLRPEDLAQDWNRVIPCGPWREGAEALHRASAIILHAPPEEAARLEPAIRIKAPNLPGPFFSCSYLTKGLCRPDGRNPMDADERYILVSAVGSPAGVEATAGQVLPGAALEHMRFADHHFFTRADKTKIGQRADELGARRIVCTPKDGVKLEDMNDPRLCILDVQVDIRGGLDRWLSRRLGLQTRSGSEPSQG
jgi:tetraacyldisaccharide 4'-kinase